MATQITASDMTIEHLGDSATNEDLVKFRSLVTAILPAFGGDEAAATDYAWNDGSFTSRTYTAAWFDETETPYGIGIDQTSAREDATNWTDDTSDLDYRDVTYDEAVEIATR